MIDDSESYLIVKKHFEELEDHCKKYKALCDRFDEFYDRLMITEAERRDRIENSLFKRFMRWVRNDKD